MSTEKLTVSSSFFNRLGEARRKAGLSKSELSRRIDVSPQVYQRYESNRIPAADILVKLSEAIGVSIDWLLRGDIGGQEKSPAGQMTARENKGKIGNSGCRIPDDCDLPGRLEIMEQDMADQVKQLDDIRKLLLSLLAEEREKNAPQNERVTEQAG